MFWSNLRVLFPSFIGYFVVMGVVCSAAWYAWTRVYTNYVFRWEGPVICAACATMFMMANTMTGIAQNNAMYLHQQKMQAQAQQAQPGQPQVDPALQAKSDFLKIVESLISNPDQITPDIKKKLFAQYGNLFPNGKKDMKVYETAVSQVYSCQRYFWEDALASFKSHKAVVSESRKACEKMPGTFFNRDKLVPVETAKSNDDTVAKLAQHKRLPASDGKEVEVTEDMLRNALDAQVKALDAIKKVFAD